METIQQINGQINGQFNGQVDFQFIRNTYPLDDKLYCYFTVPVTGVCKPEVGDWIGIYKVGWTGLGEFVCKKMITLEDCGFNPENGCGHVVFECHQLPKTLENFYQFVYIKNGELVRGASKPFSFEIVGGNTGINGMPEFVKYQPKKWIQQQWGLPTTGVTGITGITGVVPTTTTGMTTGIYTMPTTTTTTGVKIFDEYPTGITTAIPTGEYITGMQMPTGIRCPTGLELPYTTTTTGITTITKQPLQTVFTELQQGLKTIKYGLQELKQQECPRPYYTPLNWENIQFGAEWENQMYTQVERKLVELVKKEQEVRQREQVLIHAQIKSLLRQLRQHEKYVVRQPQYDEIYVREQVREFAQKLINSIRCGSETPLVDEQRRHHEYQVTRFETLLRERVALECDKKLKTIQHMQLRLRECEQRLREYQAVECQYVVRHHQMLKEKLANFQQQFVREFGLVHNSYPSGLFAEKRQTYLQTFVRDLELNFVEPQRVEQERMRQTIRGIAKMIDELEFECNEIETEMFEKEYYGVLPRGVKFGGCFKPKYMTKGFLYKSQIQQLEQQINEFKRLLKIKSIERIFEKCGFVGQEWCYKLVQKLKECEYCLKYELNNIEPCEMPVRGVHIERMLNKLALPISFLETPYEQLMQLFIDETKCKLFLSYLREIECGLCELTQRIPSFGVNTIIPINYKLTTVKRNIVVKELIGELLQLVQMRIRTVGELCQHVELSGINSFINGGFVNTTTTGLINTIIPEFETKLWYELKCMEQQLHTYKQMDFTVVEHGEYKQLLGEFERRVVAINNGWTCVEGEQLKSIVYRQMQLQQHIRELRNFWQQYKFLFARHGFASQPECMQHFKWLCKLVAVLESQLVEFHSKVQTAWCQNTQYPLVLKKQLNLFQQIKTLKSVLPYEQQELVNIVLKQRVQQFGQECELYLPAEYEMYQPMHKQIKQLIQHVRNMEVYPTNVFGGVENVNTEWELKTVMKYHVKVLKQLHQLVKECHKYLLEKQFECPITTTMGSYVPQQRYTYLLKQHINELVGFIQTYTELVGEHIEQQPELYQTWFINPILAECNYMPRFGGVEELTNTTTGIYGTEYPITGIFGNGINMVEMIMRFNQQIPSVQESIVAHLVQKYIVCLYKGCDIEFRKRFEQLYVENNKLGQCLRIKLNEVAEMRGQFEELQTAKAYLDMKLVQCNINNTTTTGIEFVNEYQPKISITVERMSPVEEEELCYVNKPTGCNPINTILGELECKLNKIRIGERVERVERVEKPIYPSWYVRNNETTESYRSLEGNLLVKLPQQPVVYPVYGGEYPTNEQFVNKKIYKLAEQSGVECIQQETTTTSFTVCPVCDIYLGKQIPQVEFELHVNGHFTD